MAGLILYTTEGCHLCERAERMLRELADGGTFRLESVDIADDPELFDRYGVRIPVVRNGASGEELGWPFSREQLAGLL